MNETVCRHGYAICSVCLTEEIERLTRERDTAREALRISEQRVREHWPENERLTHVAEQELVAHRITATELRGCHDELRRLRAALERIDALDTEAGPTWAAAYKHAKAIAREALRPADETARTCCAPVRGRESL